MEEEHGKADSGASPGRRWRWALLGFLAIGLFYLLSEHRAHTLGVLPFLIVLACPLLHYFHHAGHGRHGNAEDRSRRDAPPRGPGGHAGH